MKPTPSRETDRPPSYLAWPYPRQCLRRPRRPLAALGKSGHRFPAWARFHWPDRPPARGGARTATLSDARKASWGLRYHPGLFSPNHLAATNTTFPFHHPRLDRPAPHGSTALRSETFPASFPRPASRFPAFPLSFPVLPPSTTL